LGIGDQIGEARTTVSARGHFAKKRNGAFEALRAGDRVCGNQIGWGHFVLPR
jgi:hypothetical protein